MKRLARLIAFIALAVLLVWIAMFFGQISFGEPGGSVTSLPYRPLAIVIGVLLVAALIARSRRRYWR
jgi:hypothetical protein